MANYPYYYPGQQQIMPMQQQQQQQPLHVVRPVSSPEEARAMPTDYSAAMTIMPDLAHGAIYTKQLDYNTGGAIMTMYQRVQDAPPTTPNNIDLSDYAKRADVDALAAKLDTLINQLGGGNHDAT